MTTPTDNDRVDAGNELPEALRWQLRALRRDEPPSRDLWPDVASRLQQPAASAVAARRRWVVPVALAATLAVAIGAIGFQRESLPAGSPQSAELVQASVVQREAAGLARQYDAALGEVASARAEPSPALKSTLDELDRNLSLIHYALSQDPDSTLLLDQLRRTYSHRLALAQRGTYS